MKREKKKILFLILFGYAMLNKCEHEIPLADPLSLVLNRILRISIHKNIRIIVQRMYARISCWLFSFLTHAHTHKRVIRCKRNKHSKQINSNAHIAYQMVLTFAMQTKHSPSSFDQAIQSACGIMCVTIRWCIDAIDAIVAHSQFKAARNKKKC